MIGVLVSGEGTNLQALLDAGLPIAAVASNRTDAQALARAEAAGIPNRVFHLESYADRDARDRELADWLQLRGVDFVVLAGYMHLLTPAFLDRFPDAIVNVHPSLLPEFPGARAVDDTVALDEPDARARDVQLVLAVDAGQLRGLAADQRDARGAADLGRTFDQRRHLLEVDLIRGDVVEQDQRVGAAGEDVVDAMRGHVGPAVAQRPARARHHRLRPDRVGRRGEQASVAERVQARERAEPFRPGRLDGRAQPLDNSSRGLERDAGARIALRPGHRKRSA